MSEQQAEPAPSTPAIQPPSSADVAMVVSTTTVSAHFKMIFLTVLGLTVITLVARIGMAVAIDNPNDSVKDAMTTCGLLANAGFGAILGLIGGKVA